jgi:hypothetical protein
MTEDEWQDCEDPTPMRKYRLLVAGAFLILGLVGLLAWMTTPGPEVNELGLPIWELHEPQPPPCPLFDFLHDLFQ